MFALTRQNFELFLLILTGIFTFLTYSPQDEYSFWMYWVSIRAPTTAPTTSYHYSYCRLMLLSLPLLQLLE